jgi:hypothetical protein
VATRAAREAAVLRLRGSGRGGIANEHSIDDASPPPLPLHAPISVVCLF